MEKPLQERPCAAPGLKSYRCKGRYGWIMIGALNHKDAIREAKRSTDLPGELQMWDGHAYRTV